MTPDQTKELQDIYSRLGRILQPVPAPLEVGKWYTETDNPTKCCFRTSDCGNYGFNISGRWVNSMFCGTARLWHLSTTAELLPLFIAEAKRRGVVPGVKVRRGWDGFEDDTNITISPENYAFNIETNRFKLNGTVICDGGQWATVLPNKIIVEAGEYTPEQLIEMANKNK